MDANHMTPKELRELADKKEDENKIIKIGFLKEDLYSFDNYSGHYNMLAIENEDCKWIFTKYDKHELIEQFHNSFDLVLKKGTKFVCYNIDGVDLWFDDINYGLESMENDWAEEYLEGITHI